MQPAVQLLILLSVLPAQLLISHWMTPSASERTKLLQTFGQTIEKYKERTSNWFLSLSDAESWKKWLKSLQTKKKPTKRTTKTTTTSKSRPRHVDAVTEIDDENERDPETSPATEVLKMNFDLERQHGKQSWRPSPRDEHFAASRAPRTRSSRVLYRVGQVIRHKRWGYRGVIVGWDEYAKAPEFWLRMNHPQDKPQWRQQPNYAILVDKRDRPDGQETYVPQENIEIIANTKINHHEVEDFFDSFDGTQYLPNSSLREVYPED
ncbi:uncharacterized protein [Oscarella lobularis]|uniref:uncharacterized protein n=1 Tax=Oscarella lobularis TaxID=121494 RepID=UPI0033134A2F